MSGVRNDDGSGAASAADERGRERYLRDGREEPRPDWCRCWSRRRTWRRSRSSCDRRHLCRPLVAAAHESRWAPCPSLALCCLRLAAGPPRHRLARPLLFHRHSLALPPLLRRERSREQRGRRQVKASVFLGNGTDIRARRHPVLSFQVVVPRRQNRVPKPLSRVN
jgi:hypothetical protein